MIIKFVLFAEVTRSELIKLAKQVKADTGNGIVTKKNKNLVWTVIRPYNKTYLGNCLLACETKKIKSINERLSLRELQSFKVVEANV